MVNGRVSEGTFLFYNPDVWTGNFRISAFKGAPGYGDDAARRELKENPSATQVQAGAWLCAYSKETFCEQGKYYVAHLWVTGKGDVAFECSFTVSKGESPREGEAVVASLEVRHEGQPYPAEVIPLRLSEMYAIDEHCNRLASLLKKELKKEFRTLRGVCQRGGRRGVENAGSRAARSTGVAVPRKHHRPIDALPGGRKALQRGRDLP